MEHQRAESGINCFLHFAHIMKDHYCMLLWYGWKMEVSPVMTIGLLKYIGYCLVNRSK